MNKVAPQRTEKRWVSILRWIWALLYASGVCLWLLLATLGAPIFEKMFKDVIWWNTNLVEPWAVIYVVGVFVPFLIYGIYVQISYRRCMRSPTKSDARPKVDQDRYRTI
ncbi:MAG: hypothetical protein F4219_01945 [Gammaproteobacteria bacterium]|nr:hypothetical protein [Gammaproteobacteria bacterium]